MSLTSGRIAEPWKTAKTVFIPKPGKEDYNTAKSFRPISLMSFILKTLERLIFWSINDTHMVANPLNKNVYSYREGVSTETALHRLTYQIEKALANKQFAIVIFLDISGAFSNTAIHSLVRALARKGVEEELIRWIYLAFYLADACLQGPGSLYVQSIIRTCS